MRNLGGLFGKTRKYENVGLTGARVTNVAVWPIVFFCWEDDGTTCAGVVISTVPRMKRAGARSPKRRKADLEWGVDGMTEPLETDDPAGRASISRPESPT